MVDDISQTINPINVNRENLTNIDQEIISTYVGQRTDLIDFVQKNNVSNINRKSCLASDVDKKVLTNVG